jgi:O-antigen/teichoic acid export membrane protein
LFCATVGYALYFVGLDFYIYTTREILKVSSANRGRLLKSHAFLSLGLYLLFLPIIYYFFKLGFLPENLFIYFLCILILEHFNQEVFRLLVALSKQVTASSLLFIRQGSWAIGDVLFMLWEPLFRSIDFIFLSWLIADCIAALIGIYCIAYLKIGGWRERIDFKWIKEGIRISLLFLVATIALRSVQTMDRYWIESLMDMNTVAAYVLFIGIAGTLLTFLDAGVFSFSYPVLIKKVLAGEYNIFYKNIKRMLLQTLGVCLLFGIMSLALLPYLLHWIGNEIYTQLSYMYPWLLSAMIIYAISMVPHYALYTQRMDQVILYSQLMGLFLFVTSTYLISLFSLDIAVLLGLNIAFASILAWKGVVFLLISYSKMPVSKQEVVILMDDNLIK